MEKDKISYLESIKKSKFNFIDVDKKELLDLLMNHIGDENPYVRDDLVYEILAHLFYDQVLDENTLEDYILKLVSDDYLSFDLNNKHTNSVLKRSFSILQCVILVHVHIRDHIIDQKIILSVFDKFLTYFSKEDILTGYDINVGWIHTVAHSADLMKALMQVTWFDQTHLKKMFQAISVKMKNRKHFYAFNEDERMADALIVGLNRHLLTDEYVINWLNGFSQIDEEYHLPDDVIIKKNIKQLLRSLYFKCLKEPSLKTISETLESILI